MSITEIEAKARELHQLQALIDEAQAEADAIRDTIKNYMGDTEELRAGEYKITWKHVTSTRLDTTALKKAHQSQQYKYLAGVILQAPRSAKGPLSPVPAYCGHPLNKQRR